MREESRVESVHTWLTLARKPNPCPEISLPTYITGVSPVNSVKSAMFDDEGAEGRNDPAANTPDDVSAEKARAEMIPANAHTLR